MPGQTAEWTMMLPANSLLGSSPQLEADAAAVTPAGAAVCPSSQVGVSGLSWADHCNFFFYLKKGL